MPSKLRIIVSGLAALQPVGGMAWHYFQYVIGLARLGHNVIYHEDTWSWPFDPVRNENSEIGDYSAKFISRFFETYAPDLEDSWHYLHLHEQSFGMRRQDFDAFASEADIFLNISGANFIPEKLNAQCVKVFVDTDPGYNQVLLSEKFAWSEFVDRWCQMVAEHDIHFTFGENIGKPGCTVPTMGYQWKPTRMPTVMDLWADCRSAHSADPWTTVMSWNVFKGPVVYQGVEYGDKSLEFQKIIALPDHAGISAQLALGGGKAPVDELKLHNWEIVSAPAVTRSASDYQKFISASCGELSIAKNIYVDMKTGWFSDRSACYLAAGKPVVLQDTGFSDYLPTGSGLLCFSDQEEAIDAIRKVELDFKMHKKFAEEICREYFDSDVVLKNLLEAI